MSQPQLPDFVAPMLAKSSAPFDSDEFQFEVKWDGTRAVAYIDQHRIRLMNRRRFDITDRYPELQCLQALPAGTMLDGEIVVLDAVGKADFPALQSREQARSALKIQTLSQASPVTYLVFDQMYQQFASLMQRPLQDRRAVLDETTLQLDESAPVFVSQAILGAGTSLFETVVAQQMEGVMAKRLTSRYEPGKRSDAWLKIKRSQQLVCVIFGYVPKQDDFESLILAAEVAGQLRYVGRVGSGFDFRLRGQLNQTLRTLHTSSPLLKCKAKGQWVEPRLYCNVRFMELTAGLEMRAPVFVELLE
ncbi:MAG: non-homologous end-joining DNA ligase [Pirellulaceae bacterium]